MNILTKSKNLNVVQLTDSELAALLTPSIKIETVDRDDAYDKNFADMSGEDFFHTLQFHYHAATCGKIDPDKFKIIFRDIFSYLTAHNIPIAQFADNNINLDSKSAFKLAVHILQTYCDEFICCLFEPRLVFGEGTNSGAYTCIAELIQSVAKANHTEPLAIAEIILKYFKEVKK